MKCLALFLCVLVFSIKVFSSPATPRALLINSYHPQYAWTHQLTQGVVDALLYSVAPENIHVEFMDSRRFNDDPVYNEKMKDMLRYKYEAFQPDILITSDDSAYHFMLENREALFPGKPLVFCGLNVFDPELIKDKLDITGILEGMAIEENLKLIQQMQPKIDKVILLGDKTDLGLRMVEKAQEVQKNWIGPQLMFEIWDDFTMEELYIRAEALSDDSAIFILAIHKDRNGEYFSYEKEFKVLAEKSAVPIYGMWGGLMVGNGAIGGFVNDPYQHGNEAGYLAVAILEGVEASLIDILPKAVFVPKFDFEILQRFNIDLDLLPKESHVINQPVSLYRAYKTEINGVIVIVFILVVIINLLLINIRKRIHFEAQLDHLNTNLELKIKFRTKEVEQRNKELELAHKRMEELANTDLLTGLGNRRAAQIEVESYINRTHKEGNVLSIALLDIDFFKRVNDEYGHQVGDDVLFGFAQVMKAAIRPSDRVYRWGGEEFLILFPNTELDLSTAVCNRIIRDLHNHKFEHVGSVTASIGVACLGAEDNMDSIVNRADEYLYKAKDNGRDQVVIR